VTAGVGGLSVDASTPVLNSAPAPPGLYGALGYTCRQVADGAQGGAAVLASAWRRRRWRRRDWCCCRGRCAPAGADIDQLHEPHRPLAGGHRVPSCSGVLVEGGTSDAWCVQGSRRRTHTHTQSITRHPPFFFPQLEQRILLGYSLACAAQHPGSGWLVWGMAWAAGGDGWLGGWHG
jgi:hypothetical protein